MPKVSKATADLQDHGPVTEWSQDVDGYTINIVRFNQDLDATPLLKGLPDDRCHSPHWGYVLEGRLTFRVDDHEEVFEAGDAFYLPPGHIPIGNEPGSEYLQFSPAKELREVSARIMENMQAMQSA
jgi:mannose-6-phosphate isomerase-like protein (cupin superfamily)